MINLSRKKMIEKQEISALDKITDRSEDLKRVPVETWANTFLKKSCANLGLKLRFGVIAAIDCLYAVSVNEKFRQKCADQNIPLIIGLHQALEEYGESKSENQSEGIQEPDSIWREDHGGIGSVLSITDRKWPPKVR
ncbi:hypothetical protein O4H49_20125 [Kiloniella laminariae]|uniref:Uncharacterized protein n=1 Tax=Kiloniella laminariae TaxID=454162 RepID=A0ABT4LPP3_9PROT|nr:hypothetical protein [Kiloniella laminariae]MCZ4283103.1 hypothetical protein [Kiloniella laminariae]